jgi:hypothetical protein
MKTSRAMFGIKFRVRQGRRLIPRGVLVLALLQIALLAALAVNPAQASVPWSASSASATFGVRQFYLTQTFYNGAQAKTACAEGYHMASIWEIADPSSLEYNTALGRTSPDSGAGPPTAFGRALPPPSARGWVRTGHASSTSATAGMGNCAAWESNSNSHSGTVANLPSDWTGGTEDVGVWNAEVRACDMNSWVWCVQDDFTVLPEFLPLVLRGY